MRNLEKSCTSQVDCHKTQYCYRCPLWTVSDSDKLKALKEMIEQHRFNSIDAMKIIEME